MRRAIAALLALAPLPAAAQQGRVDLEQFKPGPAWEDSLAVESPQIPEARLWSFLLALHYADQPFRLVDRASGATAGTILSHQTAMDLGAAYTFRDDLELGIAVPVALNQAPGGALTVDPALGSPPASGLGDLRILPKARLWHDDRWALGAAAPLSLPTAAGNSLLGHSGLTLRPRGLASLAAGPIDLDGMAGLALRSEEQYLDFQQAIALDYGLAAAGPLPLKGQDLSAVATLAGEWGLTAPGEEERPLELLAGIRWRGHRGWTLTAGGGPGLTRGAGTPDYRLFLTVTQTVPPGQPAVVPVEAPSPVTISRESMRLLIAEPIHFETDSDRIEQHSQDLLEKVAEVLIANPWIRKLRIEGHTDDQGGDTYNLNLSQLRAIAVMRFLVKHGVEPDGLTAEGYGRSRPISANRTPEGRAANRRVDFVIVETDSSR